MFRRKNLLLTARALICAVLACAVLILAGGLLTARPAAAQLPSSFTLIVGAPAGSLPGKAATLLAGHLSAQGSTVEIKVLPGDKGRDAARMVVQSFSEPGVLLVAENLTLSIQDLRGVPLIKGLLPIAKMTDGMSTVLFVRAQSSIQRWEDFVIAARKSRLKAASAGRVSEVSLPLTLIEKRWGLKFQDVDLAPDTLLDAVAAGTADFGIATMDEFRAYTGGDGAMVVTKTALPSPAAASPALRPLMTFGASRAPQFPDVPTLAEMGRDRRLAFTLSVGVYSPLGIPVPALSAMRAAALGLKDNPATRTAAAQSRFPLMTGGPDVLRATLDRDGRTAEALVSAAGQPKD